MSFATFGFEFGARAASFDPTAISGLVAWYDFSDLSTLFQNTIGTTPVTTDGQSIARANDKSGNSRVQLQGGVGAPVWKANITGGKGVARFTGVNEWLTASAFQQSAAGGGTLIVVAKFDAYSAGTQTAAGQLSNGTPSSTTVCISRGSANTASGRAYDGTSANSTDTETASDAAFHVFTLTRGGIGQILLRVDGVGSATAANFAPATTSQPFNIGSRASSSADLMIGDVAEVLLWDNNIGATSYAAVELAMKAKWATP